MSKPTALLRNTLRCGVNAGRKPWASPSQQLSFTQLHHRGRQAAPPRNQPSILSYTFRRSDSSLSKSPASDRPAQTSERRSWRPAPHRNPDEPVYEMYFTCKPCKHRSAHTISKQGYHNGTVLVKCPSCQVRHLISDHLKIFSDESITVEDLLAQKGESIEKGTVSEDGDVEFWEDRAMPKSKAEQ